MRSQNIESGRALTRSQVHTETSFPPKSTASKTKNKDATGYSVTKLFCFNGTTQMEKATATKVTKISVQPKDMPRKESWSRPG
jgi:hypothetical protein